MTCPEELEKYSYAGVGLTFHSTFAGFDVIIPVWDTAASGADAFKFVGVQVKNWERPVPNPVKKMASLCRVHTLGDPSAECEEGVEFVRSRCVAIILWDIKRNESSSAKGGGAAKGGAAVSKSPFMVTSAGDRGVEEPMTRAELSDLAQSEAPCEGGEVWDRTLFAYLPGLPLFDWEADGVAAGKGKWVAAALQSMLRMATLDDYIRDAKHPLSPSKYVLSRFDKVLASNDDDHGQARAAWPTTPVIVLPSLTRPARRFGLMSFSGDASA